jgi:hypothetical protein
MSFSFDKIKFLYTTFGLIKQMPFIENEKPILVEPGVKYFLKETLKQCKEFKNKYNNLLFNIGIGGIFFIIVGSILYVKYKGKPTPLEKEKKNKEKEQYILSKIKNFQDAKRIAQQELITGLPHWDNVYNKLQG